ncbi:MAG: hypothetical protein K2J39_02280, partial [Ruminococcus sp.]|nr:hypothetical protein [Ruminococcus sp.]
IADFIFSKIRLKIFNAKFHIWRTNVVFQKLRHLKRFIRVFTQSTVSATSAVQQVVQSITSANLTLL